MKNPKNNLYELIIIGGGPAGITGAIYGARENLKILLITKDIGGQVKRKAIEIENYPGFEKISGQALIQKFENHLKKFRVKVLKDRAVKIKKTGKSFFVLTAAKKRLRALSIIVAAFLRFSISAPVFTILAIWNECVASLILSFGNSFLSRSTVRYDISF